MASVVFELPAITGSRLRSLCLLSPSYDHILCLCISGFTNGQVRSSSTHGERLSTLLDNEAFYQMGEDVGLD